MGGALPALFPGAMGGVDRDYLFAEQLLDSLPDLDLVGMRRYFKDVLIESLRKQGSLLGQANVTNDLCGKVHGKLAIDALGDFIQCAVRDDHLLETQQVLGVDIGRAHELHPFNISRSKIRVLGKRLRHDQRTV